MNVFYRFLGIGRDNCWNKPCANAGSCFDRDEAYICMCGPQFTGETCSEGRSYMSFSFPNITQSHINNNWCLIFNWMLVHLKSGDKICNILLADFSFVNFSNIPKHIRWSSAKKYINKRSEFRSVPNSFLLVFPVSTLSHWAGILLSEPMQQQAPLIWLTYTSLTIDRHKRVQ